MKIVKSAKQYEIATVKGEPITVTFFHKEEGAVIDGITSEMLLEVLIHRHREFLNSVETQENINIFTHLSQAKVWMNARNLEKQRRNKQKAMK